MTTSAYPPINKIAVMKSGWRIEIWPNESDDSRCFTGCRLDAESNWARQAVLDVSVFWLRSEIDHIEEPTEMDRMISPHPQAPL